MYFWYYSLGLASWNIWDFRDEDTFFMRIKQYFWIKNEYLPWKKRLFWDKVVFSGFTSEDDKNTIFLKMFPILREKNDWFTSRDIMSKKLSIYKSKTYSFWDGRLFLWFAKIFWRLFGLKFEYLFCTERVCRKQQRLSDLQIHRLCRGFKKLKWMIFVFIYTVLWKKSKIYIHI